VLSTGLVAVMLHSLIPDVGTDKQL
jgi:hypothetical protein